MPHPTRTMPRWFLPLLAFAALAVLSLSNRPPSAHADPGDIPVDFSREVRPLLARHCFKCHGPDDAARKANLRLDEREAALRQADSGARALVPGDAQESELIRRIFSTDEVDQMPPLHAKLPLTQAQKHLLQRWVQQGAEYTPHWAFVPPRPGSLPSVRQTEWVINPIDRFVLARLEHEGLTPSPRSDKYTLVRRVYLDLLGYPPTPEEADAFVADPRDNAYELLVDRLLDSPHYGERWARRWLDLARYADTNGYEKDRQRSIWPWRDWVIGALNADLPFDHFTIQQLAGDLLPGAGPAERIATGFHRNTMLNEEGGIDPLEFRFHAMTDRLATTGTAWLGLTVMCAQCHNHKYDPISQREYYSLMAFLNNADEPTFEVPDSEIQARRDELDAEIARRTAELPERFPLPGEFDFQPMFPDSFASAAGATGQTLADGSILVQGTDPEADTYTVTFAAPVGKVAGLRLEAIADERLPSRGPGRTPHGNFVLSELDVKISVPGQAEPSTVRLSAPQADFSQDQFRVADVLDGRPKTGWAIHGPGNWNVTRTATFRIEPPVEFPKGAIWTATLRQEFGTHHTLGRFRLSLGTSRPDDQPLEDRRRAHLQQRLNEWTAQQAARTVRWTVLEPTRARANLPLLKILPDQSILVSSDMTKRDVYDVELSNPFPRVTAIRLEVLPDPSLPQGGPGRVYYEGPFGDFYLSHLRLSTPTEPEGGIPFASAVDSFHDGANQAAGAIDADPLTGWSINGGQGDTHFAVFRLAEPLDGNNRLQLQLIFEKYYAAGLGRFRVWGTDAPSAVEATGLPVAVEEALLTPAATRTQVQRETLLREFCERAPELAGEREAIAQLRRQRPTLPTTLVLTERPAKEPRVTFVHKRGEFLQPGEAVDSAVPAFLPNLPAGPPQDRLAFAKWLVSGENPLTGRVVMNRHWGAIFGRGIVRTVEDFGFRGEPPTHPELLDWLAVEFVRQGWSQKAMHRLMVTSATYRQSGATTPELQARDPQNRLLARGPRFRLEAELVRDTLLKIGGLLSDKVGGPSVFPAQPPGVTSEGSYGSLAWNVSIGPDRYRRGLYTFSKRTAPYAMFSTFDSPSGEACVARREVSNTPLQALTLLNDPAAIEAAQALGSLVAARQGTLSARAEYLFRRCLVRPPTPAELNLVTQFVERTLDRLKAGSLDAAAIAGPGNGDPLERAGWTLAARALLNLDETITR